MDVDSQSNKDDKLQDTRPDSGAMMSSNSQVMTLTQTQTQLDGGEDACRIESPEPRMEKEKRDESIFARLISLMPDKAEILLKTKESDPQNQESYTLGRSGKCDITYSDARISVIHAKIYRKKNDRGIMELWIEDTSANGTFVQTNVIRGYLRLSKGIPHKLQTGDEISLVNPNVQPRHKPNTFFFKESAFLVVVVRQSQDAAAIRARGTPEQHQHRMEQSAGDDDDDDDDDEFLRNSQDYTAAYNRRHHQPEGEVRLEMQSMPTNSISSGDVVKSSVQALLDKNRVLAHYYEPSTEILGHGSYAQVRRCRRKADGTLWAVKIISTRFLKKQNLHLILREAEMLCSLRHPSITQLEDIFADDSHVYLIMQLCMGGDLFDRILAKPNMRYEEDGARKLVQNILEGIAFLHDNNVAHRDIKPENILLTSRECDVTIKISDFGLAKRVDETSRLRSVVGTPIYYAPEIMERMGTLQGIGEYSVEADMWSMGVLIFVLLCGSLPWDIDDPRQMEGKRTVDSRGAQSLLYPEAVRPFISSEAQDLIAKLLVVQPAQRLTARQALAHTWFRSSEVRTCPASELAVVQQRDPVQKAMSVSVEEIPRENDSAVAAVSTDEVTTVSIDEITAAAATDHIVDENSQVLGVADMQMQAKCEAPGRVVMGPRRASQQMTLVHGNAKTRGASGNALSNHSKAVKSTTKSFSKQKLPHMNGQLLLQSARTKCRRGSLRK